MWFDIFEVTAERRMEIDPNTNVLIASLYIREVKAVTITSHVHCLVIRILLFRYLLKKAVHKGLAVAGKISAATCLQPRALLDHKSIPRPTTTGSLHIHCEC
jgi:hypothetical protein